MKPIKTEYNRPSFSTIYRIAIPIVMFVAMYALQLTINILAGKPALFTSSSTTDIALELGTTISFCIILSEISYLAGNILLKRIVESVRPYQAFITHLLIMFLVYAVLITLFTLTAEMIWGEQVTFTSFDEVMYWGTTIFSFMLALFISAIHAGFFFLNRWIKLTSESADLRIKTAEFGQAAVQAELNALKLQIDPHFVFNNFSVLSELILEDSQQAVRFLEHLSKVYRYIITNLHTDVISIDQELNFLRSYTYLISIRHGEDVRVMIDIDEALLKRSIPPATLQLLVENAIKHNIATDTAPLTIRVFNRDDQIIVQNQLNKLLITPPSTRVGLKNIINRYLLLNQKEPVVKDGPGVFEVMLPVI